MTEKFSLQKFVMSFFQWLPWLKTFRHLIGILIVILIVAFIYTKFFAKETQNTTFQGDVDEVNIISQPKKFFIPFVEGFVEQQSDRDMSTGIRGGLRFEF
jgi:hypothetical protein